MLDLKKSGVAGVLLCSVFALSPSLAASPPLAVSRLAPPPAPIAAPAPVKSPTYETLKALVDSRAAQPLPARPALACLARTVYREASNQALRGQLAVAQVIINRTRSGAFPKTVCAVVGQPGQFSHNSDPMPARQPRVWATAVAISALAEEGRVGQVVPGALYFHADYVEPSWSHSRARVAQIGDHIFYR